VANYGRTLCYSLQIGDNDDYTLNGHPALEKEVPEPNVKKLNFVVVSHHNQLEIIFTGAASLLRSAFLCQRA
jgi:hypothetical protein